MHVCKLRNCLRCKKVSRVRNLFPPKKKLCVIRNCRSVHCQQQQKPQKPFEIEEGTRHIQHAKRFHATEDAFTIINHMGAESTGDYFDHLELLDKFYDELIKYLYGYHSIQPDDYVQLNFEKDDLLNRFVSTLGMPAHALTKHSVNALVQRLFNSGNGYFLFDGSVKVRFVFIRNVDAGGLNRSRNFNRLTFGLREHMAKMKSVVLITPNANEDPDFTLCCSRAIAVGLASALKHPKYQSIARSERKPQFVFARKLRREAKVGDGRCALPEWKKFGALLEKKYACQLIILDGNNSFAELYKSNFQPEKVVGLVCTDGHVDTCTKIHALLGKNFRCNICGEYADHKSKHKCTRPCGRCQQYRCPDRHKTTGSVRCDLCNRTYMSFACYDLHLTCNAHGKNKDMTVCEAYARCGTCLRPLISNDYRPVSSPHICYAVWCSFCRTFQERDHLCFQQTGEEAVLRKLKRTKKKPQTTIDLAESSCDEDDSEENEYEDDCSDTSDAGSSGENVAVTTAALEPISRVCEKPRIVGGKYVSHKFAYDLETSNSPSRYHEPTHAALMALDDNELEKLWTGENCVEEMLTWILKNTNSCTFICHNARGYDHVFVLRAMEKGNLNVEKLQDGTKITAITLKNNKCRFICSLSFLPQSLAKLPQTLGIADIALKGFFPHNFHTTPNRQYVGSIPPKEAFGYEKMNTARKAEFDAWYDEKRLEGEYDLQEECSKYCVNDVLVLRECLKIKRQTFKDAFGLDPFDCVTAPSAVSLAFQYKYLEPNTIGIVPASGYGSSHNQSTKALEFVTQLEVDQQRPLQHCRSAAGEASFGGLPVDAFDSATGKVYQFHGCYFHSCPKHFPDTRKMNTLRMMTHGEIREENDRKEARIRADSKVLDFEIMWECAWDEKKKQMKAANVPLFGGEIFRPRLHPRDHLFGGRVEVFRLLAELDQNHMGKVYDFISLYPSIMIFSRFPVGHPEVIMHSFADDISEYFGIVFCTLLPPSDLFVPVLPCRLPDGRTTYTLCRTCSEELRLATACTHQDDPAAREITGAYITPWLLVALKHGYKITKIYEVHHFPQSMQYDPVTGSHGLFSRFMVDVIKTKVLTSGFPKSCNTAQLQQQFCDDHLNKMGLHFTPDEVKDNPGAREGAKGTANCSWGRFVMRTLFTHYKYVTNYKELREIIFNSENDILDWRQVNPGKMDVTFRQKAGAAKPHPDCNAYIGVFVTSYGQMKLFEHLHREGTNLFYCDTDSKMVARPKSVLAAPDTEVGNVVGDLSDDLKGKYFVEFAALAKKTYTMTLNDGTQVNKAKGIPKDEETKKRLSMKTCREMLLGTGPSSVLACDTTTFSRDVQKFTIQTVPQRRRVRCTMTSRVIGQDFITYPFGYKNIPFPFVSSPEFEVVNQLLSAFTPELLQEEYYDEPLVQDEYLV